MAEEDAEGEARIGLDGGEIEPILGIEIFVGL